MINPMVKSCRYYDKHIDTIRSYINCLYSLEGCGTGGLLHIVTDDGNVEDKDILWCFDECSKHREKEEHMIGMIICLELIKLPIEKRRLAVTCVDQIVYFCNTHNACEKCWIKDGE